MAKDLFYGKLKWAFDPEAATSLTAAIVEERHHSQFPLGKESWQSHQAAAVLLRVMGILMIFWNKVEQESDNFSLR